MWASRNRRPMIQQFRKSFLIWYGWASCRCRSPWAGARAAGRARCRRRGRPCACFVQPIEDLQRVRVDVPARNAVVLARDDDGLGHEDDYRKGSAFPVPAVPRSGSGVREPRNGNRGTRNRNREPRSLGLRVVPVRPDPDVHRERHVSGKAVSITIWTRAATSAASPSGASKSSSSCTVRIIRLGLRPAGVVVRRARRARRSWPS